MHDTHARHYAGMNNNTSADRQALRRRVRPLNESARKAVSRRA